MSVDAEPNPNGLRVLVVEDLHLIADMIVDELLDGGYRVVGPAARLDEGLELARTAQLDGALLDVNLAGELCFPIADALVTRGVPFAFLTGYGEAVLPIAYRDAPRVAKPFNPGALTRLVGHFAKGE
jgi:DNA-binding response OmpR family regulator